ncbi:hypothetical protein L208DRAFT_1380024 [Tricholoma matsutake]|nr:hypothetical protein L208DRAFT_1380024 [Tricholoma matsutake 945]
MRLKLGLPSMRVALHSMRTSSQLNILIWMVWTSDLDVPTSINNSLKKIIPSPQTNPGGPLDASLKSIVDRLNATANQVLLAWVKTKEVVVIINHGYVFPETYICTELSCTRVLLPLPAPHAKNRQESYKERSNYVKPSKLIPLIEWLIMSWDLFQAQCIPRNINELVELMPIQIKAMISQLMKPGHQRLFFVVFSPIAFIKNAKIQLQKAAAKDSSLPRVLMNYTELKAASLTLAPEDWCGEARIDTGWENIEHLMLPEVEQ